MAAGGAVFIDPNSQSATVTITRAPSAQTPSVYTSSARSSTHTMPKTITTTTAFWLAQDATYTVTVTVLNQTVLTWTAWVADDTQTKLKVPDLYQAGLIDDALAGALPSGLTGATQPTRYVGATTSGAPVSGTFAVGDFVVSQDGKIYVATGAGTPGTWVDVAAFPVRQVQTNATASGAVTMGAATSYRRYDYTLSDNTTLTAPAAVAGTDLIVQVKQAAAGNKTLAWSGVKWAGGSAPTLTATADAVDQFALTCVSTGVGWVGRTLGQNVS